MKTEHLTHSTPQQLDQLMSIWLSGNLTAHPFVHTGYWHEQAPFVRAALQEAEIIMGLADDPDDRILGFIGLQANYIAGLFIRKDAQHQGIGTALLTLVKNNHQCLRLNVYIANRQAVAFYHHSGFRVLNQTIDQATNQPEYTMQWQR